MYLNIFDRVEQVGHEALEVDAASLYQEFEQVKDGRKRKGKRYPLAFLLTMIMLGKMAGETSLDGIIDWINERKDDRLIHTAVDGKVMRLPIRQIRELLQTLHGVEVSIGEIAEVLHRLVIHAQPVLDGLLATLRASPAVQADETGWREDGLNGSIWSVSTSTIRYYEYHHSRAGEVIKQMIGEDFGGILCSDFYAGYNIHQGLHQRCWVHFLRDAHTLKEDFPTDEALLAWAASVKAISDEAVLWAEQGPDLHLTPRKQSSARVAQQHAFEERLWQLCQPYVRTQAPQHTLCERVERFLPELFVFVAVPGVPAHNNLAERSVRPLVIARKISGGTRSPKGSQTRMGLASLFGTWMAQGLNPFHQCLTLLSSKTSLGEV